jgi:hypothetical protein
MAPKRKLVLQPSSSLSLSPVRVIKKDKPGAKAKATAKADGPPKGKGRGKGRGVKAKAGTHNMFLDGDGKWNGGWGCDITSAPRCKGLMCATAPADRLHCHHHLGIDIRLTPSPPLQLHTAARLTKTSRSLEHVICKM